MNQRSAVLMLIVVSCSPIAAAAEIDPSQTQIVLVHPELFELGVQPPPLPIQLSMIHRSCGARPARPRAA